MELVPKHFYLDEKLYKKIRVVKSENYVVAWSYEDEKRVWLDYSYVRKNAGQAYSLIEVCRLLEKPIDLIASYIKRNLVDKPSGRLYTIKNRAPLGWMWSEQDVLDIRDVLFDLAPKNMYGEPFSSLKLISKSELLNKMRKDTSLYIRNSNGEFIKVWRAE